MTSRDNILLVLDQYAAAQAVAATEAAEKSITAYSVGTEYCVVNLLEAIDWSSMAAPMIREIFAFIIERIGIRAVARMSGAANQERESLREVLASMTADGLLVADINAVKQENDEQAALGRARAAVDALDGADTAQLVAMMPLIHERILARCDRDMAVLGEAKAG